MKKGTFERKEPIEEGIGQSEKRTPTSIRSMRNDERKEEDNASQKMSIKRTTSILSGFVLVMQRIYF